MSTCEGLDCRYYHIASPSFNERRESQRVNQPPTNAEKADTVSRVCEPLLHDLLLFNPRLLEKGALLLRKVNLRCETCLTMRHIVSDSALIVRRA